MNRFLKVWGECGSRWASTEFSTAIACQGKVLGKRENKQVAHARGMRAEGVRGWRDVAGGWDKGRAETVGWSCCHLGAGADKILQGSDCG